MWDESKVLIIEVLKIGQSLSIKCSTINRKICQISNIYGPTLYQERNHIWSKLSSLSDLCTRAWCMGRDFNITQNTQERFPVGRMTRGMRKFITESKLLEIPLSNGKFTWSREGRSVSRSLLDRFLISADLGRSLY